MAATLLNSPRATALSIYVVRAFVELRGLLSANKELATKVQALERKVSVHERGIAQLADAMAELLATPAPPPKRPIGFVTPEDSAGDGANVGGEPDRAERREPHERFTRFATGWWGNKFLSSRRTPGSTDWRHCGFVPVDPGLRRDDRPQRNCPSIRSSATVIGA